MHVRETDDEFGIFKQVRDFPTDFDNSLVVRYKIAIIADAGKHHLVDTGFLYDLVNGVCSIGKERSFWKFLLMLGKLRTEARIMLEQEVDKELAGASNVLENATGGINFKCFDGERRRTHLRELRMDKLRRAILHEPLEVAVLKLSLCGTMERLICLRIASNRSAGMDDDADHLEAQVTRNCRFCQDESLPAQLMYSIFL